MLRLFAPIAIGLFFALSVLTAFVTGAYSYVTDPPQATDQWSLSGRRTRRPIAGGLKPVAGLCPRALRADDHSTDRADLCDVPRLSRLGGDGSTADRIRVPVLPTQVLAATAAGVSRGIASGMPRDVPAQAR